MLYQAKFGVTTVISVLPEPKWPMILYLMNKKVLPGEDWYHPEVWTVTENLLEVIEGTD